MKRRGCVLGPGVTVVALAAALAGCGTTATPGPGASAPGSAAASGSGWQRVPLADLDSHPATLAKLLSGRPALVNLWAPWCERCKTELPALDRLSRRLEGCAVIVGVAVGEDPAHTAAFVHERGLRYPQLVDEGFHLADTLQQGRVPTTLVIDGEGTIVHVGLALDQAAVGALEATVGRADTAGHCKSNRATGSTWSPTNHRGTASGSRGHDASVAGLKAKKAEKLAFCG